MNALILRPGSADYEANHRPDGVRFAGVRPAVVLRCRSTTDVVAALEYVRRHRIPFVVRSGGHDFAGRSTSPHAVLDVGALSGVSLDGDVATVRAGTRLAEVYRELDRAGRTLPAGSGATVAISGLALGGGLGLLGRSHRLTCDRLLGAEVVLADGSVVNCDEHEHNDLFWALRGGGTLVPAVVTELRLATVPLPARATAFAGTWTIDPRHQDTAVSVLNTWQRLAPDLPDAVAASLLLDAPADPGRPCTVTLLGTAADLPPSAVDGLVTGSQPPAWHSAVTDWPGARRFVTDHAPDPGDGRMFLHSGFVPERLPSDVADELVSLLVTDRVAGEARELDLSPWAGAYVRVATAATAFPHRSQRFLLKHSVTLTGDTRRGPWLDRSWSVARPHTDGVYPNFPDPELPEPERAYWGANLERLRRIGRAHDPHDVFGRAGTSGAMSGP